MPAATIVPQYADQRWGPRSVDLFDYVQHPIRDGGAGNPILIYRHGGGGNTGFKGESWPNTAINLHTLFEYLLSASRAVHFDIIAIESSQRALGGGNMPRGRILLFPDCVWEFQRGIALVKMLAPNFGGDPSRTMLVAESWGGWLALMSSLTQPFLGGGGTRIERRRAYETRGYNSRCNGIINFNGLTDFRRIINSRSMSFAGATWNNGTLTLTATGAFTNYRFKAGDQCQITAGTSATLATYSIASRVSNDAITLATSPGATASALSGRFSTDMIDPSWLGGIFGSVGYADSDLIPAGLVAGASPQYFAEQDQLRYMVPTYNIYADQGTGNPPYGNAFEAGSNIHDYHQGIDLAAAFTAKGKSAISDTFPRVTAGNPTWAFGASGDAVSLRVYNWLAARLADV